MFGIGKKKIQHDERISKILDERNFKYEILEGGVFKFAFEFEGGLVHSGIVQSDTYEYSNSELREVNSAAFTVTDELDPRICYLLLKENQKVNIGAWGIVADEQGKEFIVFTARVSANLPGDELLEIMYSVVATAATVEERLGEYV